MTQFPLTPSEAEMVSEAKRQARKKQVYGDSQEYCPVCDKMIAQWPDGRLYAHGPFQNRCPGSGKVPAELTPLWRKS